MSSFFTSVFIEGNFVWYRGYSDGERISTKIKYKPKLYLPNEHGTWRSLHGESLEEKTFDSILSARSFVKKYRDTENFSIQGNQRYEYAFIHDLFPNDIQPDTNLIRTLYLDIEVNSAEKFARPEVADQPVTAITVFLNGQYTTWGLGDFKTDRTDIHYKKCKTETELLELFLTFWTDADIDIVAGWNSSGYDIPYLVNRITRVLGEQNAVRLSPWGHIIPHESNVMGRIRYTFTLAGIASLDLQELYKKYDLKPHESLKLGDVAELEIGETKVEYEEEYGSLEGLRSKNHQLFITYNIRDVELLVKLEKKLRLIELSIGLAYYAKINLEDVFYSSRIWDSIIFGYLKARKIAVPEQPQKSFKEKKFEGAYVKEPVPGMYKLIASFDVDSEYPNCIIGLNISPETLIEPSQMDDELSNWMSENRHLFNVESFLKCEIDLSYLRSRNLVLTPNGQLYRKDKQGMMGELLMDFMDQRTQAKNKMLELKKQAEQSEGKEKEALKSQAESYEIKQKALKMAGLSFWGSMGNQYFRYFDVRIAESITTSGQLAVRWIYDSVNELFQGVMGDKKDRVLWGDTDSAYFSLEDIIRKATKDRATTIKDDIELMDRFCKEKLYPFISKRFGVLTEYSNWFIPRLHMKRESLIGKGIITAKKHYVLEVHDKEGVKYDIPEQSVTGLEMIKSSTPKICKERLKEAVKIIMSSDNKALCKYIDDFREVFLKAPLKQIAFPRGVNNLEEYSDHKEVWKKGSPIHVKGSLLYNMLLKKFGINEKIPPIQSGEKIKFVYLKEPNPYHCNVIAFHDGLPKEFRLEGYIDRYMQFEKTFVAPLQNITDAIGWKTELGSSLEDLFE